MPSTFLPDAAMKAAQWERAKGELRAMVAIQGSYEASSPEEEPLKWAVLSQHVEDFIKNIEDNGLHE